MPTVSAPAERRPVYLNLIWHQHQPLYLDSERDMLTAPWVRTHGTKDYFDMAAMLQAHPGIHCTINLTPSLLLQIEEYYVRRLKPYVDTRRRRVDAKRFLREQQGRTEPWIDLALKDSAAFQPEDLRWLLHNPWNVFGISEVLLARFPEYAALSLKPREAMDPQDYLNAKVWFYLAYFDPDFLRGAVAMADGNMVDLSDVVAKGKDGTFRLRAPATEDLANRLVAEAYVVMANIIPIHRKLQFDADTGSGQIEISTTPFYHPILPLVYDSDIARESLAESAFPARFHYPADARAQVAKAVAWHRKVFGKSPRGMWPAEGAVADAVAPLFSEQGIGWIATDQAILQRSIPPHQSPYQAYRLSVAGSDSTTGDLMVVFRDTHLSDNIGFRYQRGPASDNVEDFVQSVLRQAPQAGEPDRLVSVILDGENAWEWYAGDHDAKQFLHRLYARLESLQQEGRILTVTPSEYIAGNTKRGVAPHPVNRMPLLESLWPGSWINADFSTWVGEGEENTAWEYLLRARRDLEQWGGSSPSPESAPPPSDTPEYFLHMAWEKMYAAEGSDWFWWYGSDQEGYGTDRLFDDLFRGHLRSVYRYLRLAGAQVEVPDLPAIIGAPGIREPRRASAAGGTMAMGASPRPVDSPGEPLVGRLVEVLFRCDAREQAVPEKIYIVGNRAELGKWSPNTVMMWDDGTHGDGQAGDGIWSLALRLPEGARILYKYTNSGRPGVWKGSEEFPDINRSIRVRAGSDGRMVVGDRFGVLWGADLP